MFSHTVKMFFKQCILLYTLYSIPLQPEAKRILAVFPLNEKSHNNVLNALAKGLAKRGHQVDVITHFEEKNPPANYNTIINLNGTRDDFVNNLSIEYCSEQAGDSVPFYAFTAGNEICELMSLESMQKLIKNPPNNPPYDLVITEVGAIERNYIIFLEVESIIIRNITLESLSSGFFNNAVHCS